MVCRVLRGVLHRLQQDFSVVQQVRGGGFQEVGNAALDGISQTGQL